MTNQNKARNVDSFVIPPRPKQDGRFPRWLGVAGGASDPCRGKCLCRGFVCVPGRVYGQWVFRDAHWMHFDFVDVSERA